MNRMPPAARKFSIGLLGIAVATALIAIRTPDMLGERIGIILAFGATCAVFSLFRQKWLLLVGSIGAVLFLLGLPGSDSGSDGEQFAAFMFLLAGLFLLMAAGTALLGNLLFRGQDLT